jgi:integrase
MAKARSGYIQQLPSGAFRVSVYAGTDPLTGRQIRLRRTCKTERAAQIELGRLLEQAAAGRQPETDATVAQLMDRYAQVADWDLSTRKANEYYIQRVIKPALGHLQVRKIRVPARFALRAAEALRRPYVHRQAIYRAPERANPRH